MCPEVADEAYPGEEASPTGRAEVGRRCAFGADGSGLACCMVVLGLKGPTFLCCVGYFCDEVALWGLSEASDSQDSVLMLKSFKDTFRLSLKRFLCPPTVRLPWQSSP